MGEVALNVGLLIITGLFVLYALVGRRLAHSAITGPMLFMAVGLAVSFDLLGSGVTLETFRLELDSEVIQVLLEATLVIILFSDAVAIDSLAVRREAFLPERLLGIGLPLTILSGTLGALVLFDALDIWGAAVIAIILAPTDAALGQSVVSNHDVPSMVRQGLSVESGLNDGIVVPFLTIAMAGLAGEMQSGPEIAYVFIREIGFAVAVGVAVGLIGGWLVRWFSDRDWMNRQGRSVIVMFLAVLSFVLADGLHGSGFIAAFVGGLAFGHLIRREYPHVAEFSEGVAHLLTMLSFFIFGALILGPALKEAVWKVYLYAALSLTVVRLVPVMLSLVRTGLRLPTHLFIGWFGPRGLASLVFIGTVVTQLETSDEITFVIGTGAIAVGLSALLHGLSAWPGSVLYARWYEKAAAESDVELVEAGIVEHIPVSRSRRVPSSTDEE